MFGLGTSNTASQSLDAAGKTQKRAIDDILGLFDSTPSAIPASSASLMSVSPATVSPQPQPQPQPSMSSLFDVAAATPPPPVPTSRLTAYTAYDKHEVKITLTPQVSVAKPGIVNILARFQVTGSTPASGLNFQAAVPKVRMQSEPFRCFMPHPQYRHSSYKCCPCPVRTSIRARQRLNRCG